MKLPIPDAVLEQHMAVLGKTRTGKSSVVRFLVEHLLRRRPVVPVSIIDPKGDWWGLKYGADGKSPGFPITIFGGDHADVKLSPRAGVAMADFCIDHSGPILIDVSEWGLSERNRWACDFLPRYYKRAKGPRRVLVFDEVHNFAPKGKIPDPQVGRMLHWMNKFAGEGLGRGVSMIVASQRSQKVHNDLLSSCETLIAMKVLHAADRRAIQDWLDGAGDKERSKLILSTISELERGEGWVWSPEAGVGPERIQFPLFSTYDSFKPQGGAKAPTGGAMVDLDQIRAKFAEFVQEAEAEDPQALRARIVQLEQQVRKAPPMVAPDPEAVAKARKDGHAGGYLQCQQEAARLMGELFGALEREIGGLLERIKEGVVNARGNAITRLGGMAPSPDGIALGGNRSLRSLLGSLPRKPPKQVRPERLEVTGKPGPVVVHTPMEMLGMKETFEHTQAAFGEAPVKQEGGRAVFDSRDNPNALPGVKGAILLALRWFHARGQQYVSRNQVAMWIGKKAGGGYFRRVISELAASGFVHYPSEGALEITPEGVEVAPNPFAYKSNFLAYRNHFNGGVGATILDTLAERGELSRAELAEAIGKNADGGYFRRVVGELATIGAIQYPGEGRVALSELAQR